MALAGGRISSGFLGLGEDLHADSGAEGLLCHMWVMLSFVVVHHFSWVLPCCILLPRWSFCSALLARHQLPKATEKAAFLLQDFPPCCDVSKEDKLAISRRGAPQRLLSWALRCAKMTWRAPPASCPPGCACPVCLQGCCRAGGQKPEEWHIPWGVLWEDTNGKIHQFYLLLCSHLRLIFTLSEIFLIDFFFFFPVIKILLLLDMDIDGKVANRNYIPIIFMEPLQAVRMVRAFRTRLCCESHCISVPQLHMLFFLLRRLLAPRVLF